MKSEIKPDHIAVNKFSFSVAGAIELTVLELSGIEEELETVELPDRTVATGGNRKATEFTMMMPLHHTAEQAFMELWFQESQDPVLPTYKKPCTVSYHRITANKGRNMSLVDVFPKKRKMPDLDAANEGDLAMVEWTMSVDDILPI